MAAAAREDTVVIPNGSANWGTNTLTITKGLTLKTANGRDSTIITTNATTVSNPVIDIVPDATARANNEIIRVEGFTFDGNNATNPNGTNIIIHGDAVYLRHLAIGNCKFRNMPQGSTAIYLRGQFRGVIYGNLFDRCDEILRNFGFDALSEWSSFTYAFGTFENLYFENNTITFSTASAGNGPGWCEIGQGGRVAARYNTWDFANVQSTANNEAQDIHGFQGWNVPPGHTGATGSMVTEWYGNTVLHGSGFRVINHRGGSGLFFNNIFSGAGSEPNQCFAVWPPRLRWKWLSGRR